MKSQRSIKVRLLATALSFGVTCLSAFATQPASIAGTLAAAGGSADSLSPVVSADGRYVLFASAANNLVNLTNGLVSPSVVASPLNVYLRDLSNETTILISLNASGTAGGNADSLPVDISTNGQFVLFESVASNLVPGDSNVVNDIFVRDVVNNSTTLVSVATNGLCANGLSRNPVMTPDGRYVAFCSAANNLASGVTPYTYGVNIYVRDLVNHSTTLASVGSLPSSSISDLPQITPDGRYVAFHSTATNLASGASTGSDIYIRDLVSSQTKWVSYAAGSMVATNLGSMSGSNCFNYVMSDDSRYVTYEVAVPNVYGRGVIIRADLFTLSNILITTNALGISAGADFDTHSLEMTPDGSSVAFVANVAGSYGTNAAVYVWNAVSGTTTLASTAYLSGIPATGFARWPVMDSTGRFVAFQTTATGLTTNVTDGNAHLYLTDLELGITTLLDVDTNGAALTPCNAAPRINADGSLIAFEITDAAIVANDNNLALDVFAVHTTAGVTEIVSTPPSNQRSLTKGGVNTLNATSVSTTGRYIAYASTAGNTNGYPNIFLADLMLQTNYLISIDTNGLPAAGYARDPAITPSGRYVAFSSSASNLTSLPATNNTLNIYVRDLQNQTNVLVSVNSAGNASGSGASLLPQISVDGRYVLYHNRSVTANGTIGTSSEALYFRDLQRATNTLIASGIAVGAPALLSTNGLNVGYYLSMAYNPTFYVWSAVSNAIRYSVSAISNAGISLDGNRIFYATNNSTYFFHAVDLVSKSNYTVSVPAYLKAPFGVQFSANGRYVAYIGSNNLTGQIYLFDFQTQSNTLISRAFGSSVGGDGLSDSPAISADGRFIAYRSFADNLIPNDTNGVSDIFLYDTVSGENNLVTASIYNGLPALGRSSVPVFSGDSQTLVFQSWASDLIAQDGNFGPDIFSYNLYSTNSIGAFSISIGQRAGLPYLTFPVISGRYYQVQFKNQLTDTTWQNFTGNITSEGNQGYAEETSSVTNRFYRVVVY